MFSAGDSHEDMGLQLETSTRWLRVVEDVTWACRWHPCDLESFAIQVLRTSTKVWAEGLTSTLSAQPELTPLPGRTPKLLTPRARMRPLVTVTVCHSSLQSSAPTLGGPVEKVLALRA